MHNVFRETAYGGFVPWGDMVPPHLKPGKDILTARFPPGRKMQIFYVVYSGRDPQMRTRKAGSKTLLVVNIWLRRALEIAVPAHAQNQHTPPNGKTSILFP